MKYNDLKHIFFDGKDYRLSNGWLVHECLSCWQGSWGPGKLKEVLPQLIHLWVEQGDCIAL